VGKPSVYCYELQTHHTSFDIHRHPEASAVVIELSLEIEVRLAHAAQLQGKRPEDLVLDLLDSAFADDSIGRDLHTDKGSRLRDRVGHLQGFDGRTWKQLAHDGHKH
jgi:hypothetical protein